MKPLPPAFRRDYARLRERQRWRNLTPDASIGVLEAREQTAELDEFLRRWQAQIAQPAVRAVLNEVRAYVNRLQTKLREIRRLDHWELLEARIDWRLAHELIAVSVKYIEVMKHAPPGVRPEMERVYREHMGRDFDPEHEYRDTVAHADQCEADFHRRWRQFQELWPEDATPAVHHRLLHDAIPDLRAWQAEHATPIPIPPPLASPPA